MTHQLSFQEAPIFFLFQEKVILYVILQSEEDKQLQEELTMLVERLSVSTVRQYFLNILTTDLRMPVIDGMALIMLSTDQFYRKNPKPRLDVNTVVL